MQWPDLTDVLRGIPWAVVGGVATRRYMKERSTDDLDISVLPDDHRRAGDALRSAGFTAKGALTIAGSQWRSPDGVEVDVVLLDRTWAEVALEEASRNLGNDRMPVLPLPFLIMMKVRSGRGSDGFDVVRMFATASEDDRALVREAVRRWDPDLFEDVDSLIEMGRLEASRENPLQQ
jgi:hypothetical protein